ncbi:hypothetical protein DFH28DRAFT_944017 [Melampsora americana]|nr:hypothetical protein DFH28DRAFT_944017 [Melampsora americana]
MNFKFQTFLLVMILIGLIEYGYGKSLSHRGRGSYWRQRSLKTLIERTENLKGTGAGAEPPKGDHSNSTSMLDDKSIGVEPQDDLDKQKTASVDKVDETPDTRDSSVDKSFGPTSKPKTDNPIGTSDPDAENSNPTDTPKADEATNKNDSYAGNPNPNPTPNEDDRSDADEKSQVDANSKPKEDDPTETTTQKSPLGKMISPGMLYTGDMASVIKSNVGKVIPNTGNVVKDFSMFPLNN